MNIIELSYPDALCIEDFSRIDREIIISEDSGLRTLGDKKDKKKIESIRGLYANLRNITLSVCGNIIASGVYSEDIIINEHFISQLVFDVLFDKHLAESPHMTLSEYCKQLTWFEWDEKFNFEQEDDESKEGDGLKKAQATAKKFISEELKLEDKIKRHESLRNDAALFGIDLNKYDEYLGHLKLLNIGFDTENKKPKYVWDYLYYNGNRKLITYKQYRRNLQKGKYSYGKIEKDFKTYDCFIKKFMLSAEDSKRNYFIRAMDFYHLEIYKRLDFIYKLAVRMETEGLRNISKNHPMLKRFHPQVKYYYIEDDCLRYIPKLKYYRPFFFIERACPESNIPLENQFEGLLYIYYIIRAITYERFNHKFTFVSDNYSDMWDFICDRFDVLSYHEPKKEWESKADKYGETVIRVKNALLINNALFWESEAKQKPTRKNRHIEQHEEPE